MLMKRIAPDYERCWADAFLDGRPSGQCGLKSVRNGLCARCYRDIFGREPKPE